MIIKKRSKNFFILIFMFFLLSFVISLALNLKSYKEKFSNRNIIQMELKNEISETEVSELEKKVLGIKGITKVSFYSKEESLKKISEDLELSNFLGNPLPDILMGHMNTDEIGRKNIIKNLENEQSIVSIYVNEKSIDKNNSLIKTIKITLLFLLIFFPIPIISIITDLYYGMCFHNFLYFNFNYTDKRRIDIKSKRMSTLPLISSFLIGWLSYCNFYFVIRYQIIKISGNDLISTFVTGEYVAISSFLACGLALICCFFKKVELSKIIKNVNHNDSSHGENIKNSLK